MHATPKTVFWQQVGVIHAPYKEKKDAPFQGRHQMATCTIEIFESYEPALLDFEAKKNQLKQCEYGLKPNDFQ
jgi:tRNA (Thr-GGU) A37 N-methylase